MPKAIVLFNGIKFSHPAVDAACNWAKANGGELLLLNLRAVSDKQPGYGFPSDLTITENLSTDKEAGEADNMIIHGNLKVAALRCEFDAISYHIHIIADPSKDELNNIIQGAEIIFTAEDSAKPGLLTVESISLMDWFNAIPCNVVYVNSQGEEAFFSN